MAKARSIIKRRQAVQNIRKITRTMELIATAKFRKALDRATEAEAFTRKIAELVADLGETSSTVTHPLLERRDPVKRALMLVLTSNRGLAGGYNGNVLRLAFHSYQDLQTQGIQVSIEVSGKRGSTTCGTARCPSPCPSCNLRIAPSFTRSRSLPSGISRCT